MITKRVAYFVLLLWVFLATGSVYAQDGLYAPVLPGDTSLVRVFNISAEEVTIDIGATRIGPVASGEASPYHPTRPGISVIFAAGMRETLTVAPATFHTVIVADSLIIISEDTRHEDPLRSQIILYNASAVPVRLDAVVPEAPLIPPLDPGSSDEIVINAIPVQLAARAGDAARASDGAVASFETELELGRGDSYAIVVSDSAGRLEGLVVTASVAPAE